MPPKHLHRNQRFDEICLSLLKKVVLCVFVLCWFFKEFYQRIDWGTDLQTSCRGSTNLTDLDRPYEPNPVAWFQWDLTMSLGMLSHSQCHMRWAVVGVCENLCQGELLSFWVKAAGKQATVFSSSALMYLWWVTLHCRVLLAVSDCVLQAGGLVVRWCC